MWRQHSDQTILVRVLATATSLQFSARLHFVHLVARCKFAHLGPEFKDGRVRSLDVLGLQTEMPKKCGRQAMSPVRHAFDNCEMVFVRCLKVIYAARLVSPGLDEIARLATKFITFCTADSNGYRNPGCRFQVRWAIELCFCLVQVQAQVQ